LIVLLIIVSSLIAFGRIASNDFINFDDQGYITENHYIKSGVNRESIQWAFQNAVMDNWIPLSLISHMVDWSLFGKNAAGHHLVSLFLHMGAVIFLFLFLNKTTQNIWASTFAAVFFALHPLRVESVAWASERKDVLCMFFGMACLYAYAFYAKQSKRYLYVVCLILFAFSLMAKSMLVTLPFVLLLTDVWPLKRWPKNNIALLKNRLLWEKVPFIFLSIIVSMITVWAQYGTDVIDHPFLIRISNAVVAYVIYLKKTFWPNDLALFYFSANNFPAWQVLLSGVVLTCVTCFVIYFLRKLPCLFVGWFWYLGTFVPVIGLVPTNALIADHYSYMPSIGIAVMLAWGIPPLIQDTALRKKILWPSAGVIVVVLMILTWQQCGYWKNSIALWNHTINVTKNNVTAYSRLGHACADVGRYQDAVDNYKQVILLDPGYVVAYNRLGIVYSHLGQYPLAVDNFNEALRLKPDYAEAYNNRAVVSFAQGSRVAGCDDAKKACSLGVCFTLEAARLKGYCR